MTKTRRAGFSKKRRRGGRKTVKRRAGGRRSRGTRRRGGRISFASVAPGGAFAKEFERYILNIYYLGKKPEL